MKTTPFETSQRPITPNIRVRESTSSEHGKNMPVVAREGVFQSTVMFKYTGKSTLSELPTFKEKEDGRNNR